MDDLKLRSPSEVFDHHLRMRKEHDLEADIVKNYAEDVVLITSSGVLRGHAGVRVSAEELRRQLPDGEYAYVSRNVEGDVAFLVWNGRSRDREIKNGVDTFVIRNGKIVVQTIYYVISESPAGRSLGSGTQRLSIRDHDR